MFVEETYSTEVCGAESSNVATCSDHDSAAILEKSQESHAVHRRNHHNTVRPGPGFALRVQIEGMQD